MTVVLKSEKLSKWYGNILGISDINLEIGSGITGLLGPNGAGKSTFLKIAAGQLKPKIGSLKIFGEGEWKMRKHGKSRSADFVLFHEEPHEQLIPHVDGFHVREYYEKRWYRGYPGAIGIPLFSYLYHEFAAGYGGDSAGLSKENSRWNVRCHAMNLVAGRTPGGSIWSSHQNMFDAHPDQIAMIRNHCRVLQTRAKDFLMLGTMLHPFELAVPQVAMGIPVQKDGKWVREDVPTPAILTSSWQSPDGRVGHLFVNIAEARQPLKVNLDTRNAPAQRSQQEDAVDHRVTDQDYRLAGMVRRQLVQHWHRPGAQIR